jgi:Mg-chelatase subunit ChlD
MYSEQNTTQDNNDDYEILHNENKNEMKQKLQPEQQNIIDDLHIILILDESGSMDGIRADIVGSVNSFIREQKGIKSDNSKITFIKFNSVVSNVYEKKLLTETTELTLNDYKPQNNTALFDAVGFALVKYSDEKNICVIIVTDGQENASKDFTREKMVELIEKQKKMGWNFVYLSADLSQMKQGENIGIHTSPNGTMHTNTQNMVESYQNLGECIRTRCNTAVKEIRTRGYMSGLGTN